MNIAFPNSEGFGDNTGGRGGDVYFITNLNDSGDGSLRDALSINDNARIAMVMVNGTINLASQLPIRSNKTLLGQTSNGAGICWRTNRVYAIARQNIIIRFVRGRFGDTGTAEAGPFFMLDCDNFIVDHSSFSWSVDETVTTFRNVNSTIQWSIISEPLHNSTHSKGGHGYPFYLGGKNVSVIYTLIAHGHQRNPRPDNLSVYTLQQAIDRRGLIDFRCNLIYNWLRNSIHGLEGSETGLMNLVNNYLKAGPATESAVRRRLMSIQYDYVYDSGYGQLYANGNIIEGENDINNDNWLGISLFPSEDQSLSRRNTPFEANVYIDTPTSLQAYQYILDYSGASKERDSVDSRIVSNVINGNYTFEGSNGSTNGLIDSQNDVGGWPTLTGGTVQDSFDQLTAWLDNNGYSDRPALADWTDVTQRNLLGSYIANIDVTTGYSIAELYANDLVINTFPIEIEPPQITYNLTLSSLNETFGTVSRSLSNPVTAGATVQLTATPIGTGVFQGWYLGSVNFANFITNDNPYSRVVNSDATIIASFIDGTPIPPEQPRKKFAKKRNEVV